MKKNLLLFSIGAATLLLFSAILFGLTGILVVIAAILIFFVPFYLILSWFDLDQEEKIFCGFFLGTGAFPTIAYLISYLVNSIRWSIVITWIVLMILGVVLFMKRKKSNN
jgi:hypothetical protein